MTLDKGTGWKSQHTPEQKRKAMELLRVIGEHSSMAEETLDRARWGKTYSAEEFGELRTIIGIQASMKKLGAEDTREFDVWIATIAAKAIAAGDADALQAITDLVRIAHEGEPLERVNKPDQLVEAAFYCLKRFAMENLRLPTKKELGDRMEESLGIIIEDKRRAEIWKKSFLDNLLKKNGEA